MPDAEIAGDEVVDVTKPEKKKRAPKTPVSLAQSRGFDALPLWIKPTIWKKIIPSLIKFYGARDNPWDLDDVTNDLYLVTLQSLVNKLHAQATCTLTRSHKIYVYVCLSHDVTCNVV